MFSMSFQGCLESVEPLPQPSDRTSHGHLHNLVSLGPVWRMNNRSLYKPVEGGALLLLFPLQRFLLSFSCCRKTSTFLIIFLIRLYPSNSSPLPPLNPRHEG